ncbi:MAG: ABC transporter permease [Bacillota bacterium]|nr:ABC transporter permease [Bacillota bacterium]
MGKDRNFWRHLAWQSLKHDRERNLLVVISTMIMALIIAGTLNIGVSINNTLDADRDKRTGTTASAELTHPSQEQLDILRSADYIETVGCRVHMGTVRQGNLSAAFVYCDDPEWDLHTAATLEDFSGELPRESNEIMASRQTLLAFGLEDPAPGAALVLDSSSHIVTAVFTEYREFDPETENILFVSGAFDPVRSRDLEAHGTAFLSFRQNPIVSSFRESAALIGLDKEPVPPLWRLTEDLHGEAELKSQQELRLVPRPVYRAEAGALAAAYLLILIPAVAGGFVLINGCFYFSLARDIRQYALLAAVGATAKQREKLAMYQGAVLAFCGMFLGCLLSIPLVHLLMPVVGRVLNITGSEVVISFNPFAYLIMFFLVLWTVWFASRMASLRVARVSVTGALRRGGLQTWQYHGKSAEAGKLGKMALSNLKRTPAATLSILVSLCLGITVFLTVALIVPSMDSESFTDNYIGTHDIVLLNDTLSPQYQSGPPLQKFDPAFMEQLSRMDGVNGVYPARIGNVKVGYDQAVFGEYFRTSKANMPDDDYMDGLLIGIESGYLESRRDVLGEGRPLERVIDIEAFERGEFLLIGADDPSLFPETGEIRIVIPETEQSFSLPIGGFVPRTFQSNLTFRSCPDLYVHVSLLEKFPEELIISRIDIDAEAQYLHVIERRLAEIAEADNQIEMISWLGTMEETDAARAAVGLLGFALAGLLILIGGLNFLNVMIINTTLRKSEFAVLRSVGMTARQLYTMLLYEGFFYWVGTLLLLSTAGGFAAWFVFRLFRSEATYAVVHFPWALTIIICAFVLFLLLSIPIAVYRGEEKKSISQTLRDMN